MMRNRYLFISIAVALTFVFSAGHALAKPTWKQRREVKTLVAEAKKLVASGNLKEATKKLKRADAIMPAPSFKVDLAKVLIDLGEFVQASDVLREAMAAKPRQWAEKKAVKKSISLLSSLEDRMPTIEITMLEPDASKAVITVGGDEYDTADGATAFNPGDYEVAAEAPGYARWSKQLTLAEGARESIEINMSAPTESESADSGGGLKFGKLPAYIAWGVGGAGLITGIAFGVAAIQTTNELCRAWECTSDGEIQPKTKEEQELAEQDHQAALTNGDVSTAGFIIGGAGVAVGTVLFLLAEDEPKEDVDKEDDDAALSITAMPAIGPGYIGLTGTF